MKDLYLIFITLILGVGNAWPQEVNQVSVEILSKTTNSWNGEALPPYPQGTPEITIEKYLIPGNTTLAWHKHPVINAGVMMRGQLTVVTKAGKSLHLSKGDTIVETVHTWHRGINEHSEPVEIIVFYAGVLDKPLTIQE